MSTTPTPSNKGETGTPISLRLFPEQKSKLKKTAKRIRLSEQDTLRKALDFGLPALERALMPASEAA